MSTSLRGYCIKVTDLQSIVKKPPAGLLAKLIKRFPEHFKPRGRESAAAKSKALLKWLESDIEGRLLEMICAVSGVRIESVFFEDVHFGGLDKALSAGMGGGVCERLKEPRLPVELPPPPKTWGGPPWISYLTLKEIKEGLARPDKKTQKLDNWVADARDDLRVWLETAREHGTDLVVFGT